MKLMWRSLGILPAMVLVLGISGCASTDRVVAAPAKERVVIQVSDDSPRTWNQALNVAGNLQKAYGPGNAEIELVSFGLGIGMLKAEALVANRVQDATADGVRILACENSMQRYKLKRNDMVSRIDYVGAGVEHIIKRQKEGWATIRP